MASFAPLATFPVTALNEPTGVSAPVPFYLSDIGWTGEPDDPDAPSRHYQPRVISPLRIDRSIPITPDAARRVLLQLGDIAIVNADGALDDLVRSMAIDGRLVRVKTGNRRARYAAFETLFQGTASGWKLAGDGSVSLTLRDASWKLDAPAQRNLYGGTGGLDGGLDVKNKPKPLAYGECLNVPPAFIDTDNLILQAHDGPVQSFDAVYDAGAPLTSGIDVANIMAAAAPAPGSYITQKSGGYIRLGSKPFGTITCDVKGDKAFGSYVSTAGGIAFRIAHDRGGLPDSEFDLGSFEALNNAQPAPVGIYNGLNQATLGDMMDAVLGGINAWWGPTRLDMIEVGRLDLPGSAPVARLGMADILEPGLQLLDTPDTINPPLYQVLVGHQRNWTPQLSSIAGSVTAERLAFLANEYRFGTFLDIDLTVPHQRAQQISLPGLFAREADAIAEAQRLQKLYAGPFQLARLPLKLQGFLIPLNRTISVDYPRYGLAGGKNVLVVGQGIDAARNESTIDILF
jgi:hypothetical protein